MQSFNPACQYIEVKLDNRATGKGSYFVGTILN